MDGPLIASLGNMEKNRVTPTPIAVIADCTMVMEQGFVVFT
jgi:hypothetical protein